MYGQAHLQLSTLRATSLKVRADSVRQRLDMIETFCSLAETDLRWGPLVRVELVLEKIHYSVGKLERHLDEPDYVPSDQVPLLRNQLNHVVRRVSSVERSLRLKKDEGPFNSGRSTRYLPVRV
jgi:hypothetical protein